MTKVFKGVVVGTKMNKTITVVVERRKAHPFYGKVMRLERKYHVHDELGAKVGDRVVFVETRPISKTKKWRLLEIAGRKEKEAAKVEEKKEEKIVKKVRRRKTKKETKK